MIVIITDTPKEAELVLALLGDLRGEQQSLKSLADTAESEAVTLQEQVDRLTEVR